MERSKALVSEARVAVVTGGGRGIGRAICLALAEQCKDIVVADLNLATAEGVAREVMALGRQALAVQTDVSSRPSVREMVAATLARFDRLDILVNNAGICWLTPFEEISDEQWAHTMAVNLTGSFICSQEAIKPMLQGGWGRIISIASVAGKMGSMRSSTDYAASKGGLIALTLCLARHYATRGITANVVAPGTIASDMTRDWPEEAIEDIVGRTPMRRLGQPEDVAAAVAFLASDDAGFITGEVLDVNGGVLMD